MRERHLYDSSRDCALTTSGVQDLRTKSVGIGVPKHSSKPQSTITIAMSCYLSQSCFRQLARSPLRQGPLPNFLVPAFSHPLRTQPFSTTSPVQSRVGGAAITVPPEVSLKFIDLPQPKTKAKSVDFPNMAVEVKGPLGKEQWQQFIAAASESGARLTSEC